MARLQGVPKSKASPSEDGLSVRPKMMKKLTGRGPTSGTGLEPMEIWAYQPKMMIGMGRLNQASERARVSTSG